MYKADVVAQVAEQLGVDKRSTEKVINAALDTIVDEVAHGGEVKLTGFGTFKPAQRAAREARNPVNGETVHVDAKTVPVFKAGKAFKDAVNG